MATPGLLTESCTDCHWLMIRGSTDPGRGAVRHEAHGLCERCYKTWHRLNRRVEPLRVDWVTVERVITGYHQRTTPAERTQIVAHGLLHGWSARRTAEAIRCSSRTVVRHRARVRIAA